MPFIINNQTRPYDFGTDAIERQRVSLGQSVIDADFEYGLQATKWQSYQEVRQTPSFYETPGTDIIITAASTNHTTTTPSTITMVTTTPPPVGSVISVSGLANSNKTADRAEGFFLVTANVASTSFSYIAKGGTVGIAFNESIFTAYTVVRRGGIFNNGNAKIQVSTISQSGTTVTVTTTTNHGLMPGTPITATSWTPTSGTLGASTQGNFFLETVPTSSTFTFTSSSSVTGSGTGSGGNIYVQPYSYAIHRPFDGGVLISPNQPTNGSNVLRQSKKVFRYQSGKGFLWSSGTLFCPNNDIVSMTASSTTLPATFTIVTDVAHGAPQPGAIVQVRGMTTASFNGTYVVKTITESTTIVVDAVVNPGVLTPVLGDQPRFIMSSWHGASIRAGTFDDQNGLFWEFDGQNLFAVKRSSTFQLAGLVTIGLNSQTVTGDASARFRDQLKVGDRITIRGMTHAVTWINPAVQNDIRVNPPYRGASAITVGVKMCKIVEIRVHQSQFNRDKIDGTGSSGYNIDLTRMQMLGIQYTWYGAGFIDWMIRATNGAWTMVHRMQNNNVNDEAYMRTGNMPVRYEVINESDSAYSSLGTSLAVSGETYITLVDAPTYWPTSGTVMIDDEMIFYTAKNNITKQLTIGTRASTLVYNIADVNKTFSGGAAATHTAGVTVSLVSCTCSPSLSHWGSALIMDGQFDDDRGYFFNFQFNYPSTLVANATATPLFFIRLAPSVSNGIVGDIGIRDLLNRAQLLLQKLDVTCVGANGTLNIFGVLNPTGFETSTFTWLPINSTVQGGQPSFTQYSTSFPGGSWVTGTGERIFSMFCLGGTQTTIDLSDLKELSNTVIGGTKFYPDGPDTLMIAAGAINQSVTVSSYNLYWSEAQA
jgi:hypothetical protein